MLVSHGNKRRSCWYPKPVLWVSTSFLMLSFVAINLHEFTYIWINYINVYNWIASGHVSETVFVMVFVFCGVVFVMSIRKKANVSNLCYIPAGHAMQSPWVPPYVPRGQGKQVVRFSLPTLVQENPGVDTKISRLTSLGRSYLTGSLDGALWYQWDFH